MALELYLEGLGFRAIGRVLRMSYVTVYYWIKEWGESKIAQTGRGHRDSRIRRNSQLCRSKKNYCWTWIAGERFGNRFIAFVCGDRSTATGLKLWDKLRDMNISLFCSDYWKSYNEMIPKEKLLQTKAETFTVEGYNSRIRHYLARFKRKGKCYSKAQHMIEKSLNLLFLKLNNELSILI
jgi:insertion element IS1 protein InsB